MTYRGRVRNGVVELPPDACLPEGAEVRVEVLQPSPATDEQDPVYSIGELAVDTGVPDLSVNLNHYLYVQPSRAGDKGWGLVDCASFVIMTGRGISEALTNDRHFQQAGFPRLL